MTYDSEKETSMMARKLIKIHESGYAAMYEGGYHKTWYTQSITTRRSFRESVDDNINQMGWAYFKSSWWGKFMKPSDYVES